MSCNRNRFLLVLFKKVREEGEGGWVLIWGEEGGLLFERGCLFEEIWHLMNWQAGVNSKLFPNLFVIFLVWNINGEKWNNSTGLKKVLINFATLLKIIFYFCFILSGNSSDQEVCIIKRYSVINWCTKISLNRLFFVN